MLTQIEFEQAYWQKRIQVVGDRFPELTGKRGFVTAALTLERSAVSGTHILAVMFEDVVLPDRPEIRWITFRLSPDMVELDAFEVIDY